MASTSSLRGDQTRDQIKLAARRLFALRGIHGVTTREIVAATGQKNGGSLHYYFRTKEALVRELIVDGAKLIDDRRNVALDAAEEGGGPRTIRKVLEILVWPSTGLGEAEGEEDSYIRFISHLGLQERGLLDEALGGRWNSGYQRCLGHLRRLIAGLPLALVEQRLVFLSLSLRAIMAAREAALDHRREHRRFWTAGATMENLIDALEGMLVAPISPETASLLAPA
ncbi:MAG: transcriptional regulator, TetR family [Alphaproteobacteria bacterium]|nr:transcriptional regulator, TetR family [Alphaproteobacteria bacterium]MDB5722636.1 transcriptional regulator, TetR family [Alphaproteobacteria bacterium]